MIVSVTSLITVSCFVCCKPEEIKRYSPRVVASSGSLFKSSMIRNTRSPVLNVPAGTKNCPAILPSKSVLKPIGVEPSVIGRVMPQLLPVSPISSFTTASVLALAERKRVCVTLSKPLVPSPINATTEALFLFFLGIRTIVFAPLTPQ